jgi:hypothetical protein
VSISHIPAGVFAVRAKSATVTYPNIPGVAPVSQATTARAVDVLYYETRILHRSGVIDELWINVTTLAAGGVARLGVCACGDDEQPLGSAIYTSAELSTASTGPKGESGLGIRVSAGLYLFVARFGVVGPTLRAIRGSLPGGSIDPAFTSGIVTAHTKASAYAAAFPSPMTPWDTAPAGTTPFENTVFCTLSSVT